jgi:hypothetical protein
MYVFAVRCEQECQRTAANAISAYAGAYPCHLPDVYVQ